VKPQTLEPDVQFVSKTLYLYSLSLTGDEVFSSSKSAPSGSIWGKVGEKWAASTATLSLSFL